MPPSISTAGLEKSGAAALDSFKAMSEALKDLAPLAKSVGNLTREALSPLRDAVALFKPFVEKLKEIDRTVGLLTVGGFSKLIEIMKPLTDRLKDTALAVGSVAVGGFGLLTRALAPLADS